ncbi:cell division protein FtsW [Candidatus Nomurabacteria bacterium]|uniref:Probable peptidoglycan glycosyltransferase FtsW n=1 Tax=Candidatus Dojkabacteria bacterium TaxID=2099670 RepID=A0A955I2N3_9BACT|nr:cell division protein FtsW [Candidatus Dojkabacteria bacterium]MCB9789944.1 cell division protein FtsW [Candidatus Nomurabacteria bacterium]MCB9803430.1 cell division protein FtsW [Candidatus Nomurabacteria bacterium]
MPKTIKKKNQKAKAHSPNRTLVTFFFLMLIFGAIMIFDASVYQADQPPFNDPYHFLKLHLFFLIVASLPATFIYLVDYRKLTKFIVPVFLLSIFLLFVVLFAQDVNGSKRWLRLGSDYLVIQPAEIMKPVFIMYLSTWLIKERKKFDTFSEALRVGFVQKLIGFIATLSLVLFLILLEPDLGTTLIIGFTALAIFLASGTDVAHLVGSAGIAAVMGLIAIIAAVIAPYRLSRVQTYLKLLFSGEVIDPQGAGYQIQQILIGIGSAGFWGKGFGQSRQRFGYLVENTAFTDSIFAVILEELGMFGGILFVVAWMIFLTAGLRVARQAPDRVGRLMATGLTVWLSAQAFFNMGANVGLIPLTGIPLPFFTYGGSSTIAAICGFALLLNISRFTIIEQKKT